MDLISAGEAIQRLHDARDVQKAEQMARYHKVPRTYLGVANPVIDGLVREWRASRDLDAWVGLAGALWKTDIHEARIAAAKLVDRRRIEPDGAVWGIISGWVADFDAWAIADHASIAGQKRLLADRRRLDEIEEWTIRDHMWSRRAALVTTLPFTREASPERRRVLGWMASYTADTDWFIQKAVGWWLRELSKHDPAAVRAFLSAHGDRMRPFARREASKYL